MLKRFFSIILCVFILFGMSVNESYAKNGKNCNNKKMFEKKIKIPKKNMLSYSQKKAIDKVSALMENNIEKAVKYINSISEEKEIYNEVLHNALNKVYSTYSDKSINYFINQLNEEATVIIKQYKEAEEERENEKLNYNAGEILVTFEANTSKEYIDSIAEELDGKANIINQFEIDTEGIPKYKREQINSRMKLEKPILAQIEISKGHTTEKALREYNDYRSVVSTARNYKLETSAITNDSHVDKQYYLDNVNIDSGWKAVKGYGYQQSWIAVIDTGLKTDHPELKNMYLKKYSVDMTVSGYPKLDSVQKKYTDFHGTAVSSVIAAQANNSRGISGTGTGAGNGRLRIMALKCSMKPNFINDSAAVAGIYYATDHGADVINISSGSYTYNSSYKSAIEYARKAGVLVVASAGNDNNNNSKKTNYPSGYTGVMEVAATTKTNKKASFSNYGASIDISAPGKNIVVCTTDKLDSQFEGYYTIADGTSFSAPIVSAVAGVMYSYSQGILSVNQIESIIKSTATKYDLSSMGSGVINGGLAIQKAKYMTFQATQEKLISVKPFVMSQLLKIQWEDVTDAEGYVIYRANSSNGSYKKIKTITSKSTREYVDGNLTKGKKYYYKIRGYIAYGSEKRYNKYSNIKYAKPE